jgi:hypothetical protein
LPLGPSDNSGNAADTEFQTPPDPRRFVSACTRRDLG